MATMKSAERGPVSAAEGVGSARGAVPAGAAAPGVCARPLLAPLEGRSPCAKALWDARQARLAARAKVITRWFMAVLV